MAKQFAIMRGDKLKTGEMRGSIAHVTRSQNTPNADPARRHLNYAVVGPAWDDPRAIQAAVEQQTPDKYRKDAVRLLEFIVTASPEWFADNPDKIEAYFESATAFYQQEYGAENVVSAVVHRDETSPHMHLYVVPVDPKTGRLNAKELFGGRGDMSRRQTAFADHMSDFGVERGKANPARKHTHVRDWYKGHADLDERETALAVRERAVAADVQRATNESRNAASTYSEARNERSAVAFEKRQLADRQALLDQRAAVVTQRESQLAALERELFKRGDKLSGGEKSLEQRQSEIDRAGAVLQQRLDAARAAKAQFEQQKSAWIAENRPQVSPLVRHLQHLETIGVIASAEYLEEQGDDDLYELFDPHTGLTERGKTLLDVQKRAEQFDQAFTQSNGGPVSPGI